MNNDRFVERMDGSTEYIVPILEAHGHIGFEGAAHYNTFLMSNQDLRPLIRDESIADVHLTAIICRRFDEWFAKKG